MIIGVDNNEKTILSKDRKPPIDIWISYIAFICGLYFDESLNYIRELDYVNLELEE